MNKTLLFSFCAALSLATAVANTITVNSSADVAANDGHCTLREAIIAANTNTASGALPGECAAGAAGFDTIEFSIAGGGVKTITPATSLPVITEPVTIDGYTQPGASANTLAVGDNAVLLIELNGSNLSGNGLVLAGSGLSTIRGLVINRFASDSAIKIVSANNVIAGCFIGVDVAGNTKLANAGGVRVVTGANNLIGGVTPAARNVLSGNNTSGSSSGDTANISLLYEGGYPPSVALATGTIIRGNYIGTNAAGTAAISDPSAFGATDGILLAGGTGTIIGGSDSDDGAADGNVGARNVISGNLVGISTRFGFSQGDVTIQGNFIGVDAAGATAIGNYHEAINLLASSQDGSGFTTNSITIGGTAAGAGNVISGTIYGSGILTNARTVVVQGNRIGTDVTGNLRVGNAAAGGAAVEFVTPFPNYPDSQATIGGPTAAARNIISGNGGTALLCHELSTGQHTLTVQGNFIGTASDGQSALGNDGNGMVLLASATIGGTNSGEGNVIAYNGASAQQGRGAGVVVPFSFSGTGPFGIAILGNSIFGNRGLGIDLGGAPDFGGGDGVTANDIGDADAGPNNLQNFPVLTSVRPSAGGINVVGTLNSRPNTTYRIEFFGNTEIDPSLNGEGRTYLGFTNVTTDENGNASFDAPVASGALVTSTATDPAGNTSEFSQSIGQLLNISTRLRARTGENVLIGGFIIAGADPKKVIVRGIGPSLSFSGALHDPTLELHDGTGATIATNDNWKIDDATRQSQQAKIEATGIAPNNDLESVIVKTLPANNARYTAIVRGNVDPIHGQNDPTGIALVEAYDFDQAANSRLANISTRGFVETGDNVLIGGFIVGNGSGKVVVRAIGPSLADSGISGVLKDPTLVVRDRNGNSVAANDNWKINDQTGQSQEAEIRATSIPPTNDLESAVVTTLLPGAYTAIVTGKNNTTGIAVVEAYNLQ